MLMASNTGPEGRFRIGQVSRMTGVPPETLRSWEARNEAVRPSRTPGGFRLYSGDDIERLKLIKALTDLGDPVGTIAGLDARSLRGRLTGGGPGVSADRLEELAADGVLPESVRKLSTAILELRLLARSGEGRDPRPELEASLVELESLLLMLCDVGGTAGS